MYCLFKRILLCLFCSFSITKAQQIKCLCKAEIRNDTIEGTISFYDLTYENKYQVNGVIYGLTPGWHGFHIHQNPDLSNECNAAGPHYNPQSQSHGCHHTGERHAGDLGNIYANENGIAFVSQVFDGQLTYPYPLCDRSIVIHADPDDCGQGGFDDSLTTGHSGRRVACAVIQTKKCKELYYNGINF